MTWQWRHNRGVSTHNDWQCQDIQYDWDITVKTNVHISSTRWLDGLEVCSWCRSSLSQRPLRTRYCHLRSSASAICSDWHSTGPVECQSLQIADADDLRCTGSRTWNATEQRSFAVNEPSKWNRLPPSLRSPDQSESTFKQELKTHLFSAARDVFMILAPDINIQTYFQLINK